LAVRIKRGFPRYTLQSVAGERELPTPDSDELKSLIAGHEAREIYRLLYERRTNPPTMTEIRRLIEHQFGAPHAQTDRRLRDLRSAFDVPTERVPGARNEFRYRLRGWRIDAESRSRRGSISPRVEAQVYSLYGNRCAMCGKTPKDDAVRLVIDHIIPLEWGGNNDVSNLQPLCEYHNHANHSIATGSTFDKRLGYLNRT
jgi:5-methylcytosine-specific restriction endonuclease McrA